MAGRSFSNEKYRFKWNGKEAEPELFEGCLTFEARIFDNRICRWLSTDPLFKSQVSNSLYIYGNNTPLREIDYLGLVGIEIITKEKQPNGTNQTYSSGVIQILTLEDIKGIERTNIIVNRIAERIAIPGPEANSTSYKSVYQSAKFNASSGETKGEKLKRESPIIYFLQVLMYKNPLGTGNIGLATQKRDPFTGEYYSKTDKFLNFASGVVDFVSAGRSGTIGEIMKHIISNATESGPDDVMFNMLKALNFTEYNNDVVEAYFNKYTRENDKDKLLTLKNIMGNGISENNKTEISKKLKNELGIDINMPKDAKEAASQKVNYDGTKK